MSTKAKSSAEKDKRKAALCWHISSFPFVLFHRAARPVSEPEASGTAAHGSIGKASMNRAARPVSEPEASGTAAHGSIGKASVDKAARPVSEPEASGTAVHGSIGKVA